MGGINSNALPFGYLPTNTPIIKQTGEPLETTCYQNMSLAAALSRTPLTNAIGVGNGSMTVTDLNGKQHTITW